MDALKMDREAMLGEAKEKLARFTSGQLLAFILIVDDWDDAEQFAGGHSMDVYEEVLATLVKLREGSPRDRKRIDRAIEWITQLKNEVNVQGKKE